MFSLFRFLNRFLFSEEKKKQYYSTYKICIPLYCSWSDEESMSPKRILNVDLSYLPKCTEFFHRF